MDEIILIPSGRANFAALVEQKPKPEDGINTTYDEDTLNLVHKDEYESKEFVQKNLFEDIPRLGVK